MLEASALLCLAYLLGSVSSAILLSKIMGFEDPRKQGSNNPGATNVLRIAGKKAAFFTLVGDFLKGLLPVLVAHWLQFDLLLVALTGFAAFVGHCFPIFFRFQGGKGVATAIAATLAFDVILWRTQDLQLASVFVLLSAILIWRHKSNIQRLIRGTET
jgi:glycerol-3-phosphate acyltransferase PlsY